MFLLRVIVSLFELNFLLLLAAAANISTSNKLLYEKLSTAFRTVKINISEKGFFQKECKNSHLKKGKTNRHLRIEIANKSRQDLRIGSRIQMKN